MNSQLRATEQWKCNGFLVFSLGCYSSRPLWYWAWSGFTDTTASQSTRPLTHAAIQTTLFLYAWIFFQVHKSFSRTEVKYHSEVTLPVLNDGGRILTWLSKIWNLYNIMWSILCHKHLKPNIEYLFKILILHIWLYVDRQIR